MGKVTPYWVRWHTAGLGLGDASWLNCRRVLLLQHHSTACAEQLECLMRVKSLSARVGLGCRWQTRRLGAFWGVGMAMVVSEHQWRWKQSQGNHGCCSAS